MARKSRKEKPALTHIDASGEARMVDNFRAKRLPPETHRGALEGVASLP